MVIRERKRRVKAHYYVTVQCDACGEEMYGQFDGALFLYTCDGCGIEEESEEEYPHHQYVFEEDKK